MSILIMNSQKATRIVGLLKQQHLIGKQFLKFNHISTSNHYDIVVAGGGLVGTTLACTLGKNQKLSNKNILLLEASKKFEFKLQEQYSNRVSALSPSTIKLFNEIDVWQNIEKIRYGVVKKMQVWDGISDAMVTFNNSDLSEAIAYIVENDVVLGAVDTALNTVTNVTTIHEAKIKGYVLPKIESAYTKIELENGENYTCDLLLGCDGANSQVRKAMDVAYMSWNYNQKGVVATVKLSDPTNNVVAWQRFLPTGPIALLPLTNNLSSLVWSTTVEHADALLKLPEEQFIDALNNAIWKTHKCNSVVHDATKALNSVLESLQLPSNSVRQLPPSVTAVSGGRAAFPLGFGHAVNYVKKGVALVGDAAHRVHPLAGQGVNLGFGDVNCLNNILGEAVYNGSYLGNINYLIQYESERQRHNVPMMMAIDGLHKLNNTEFTPFVLLRSLGLQMTHALNPLKKAIIGFAGH